MRNIDFERDLDLLYKTNPEKYQRKLDTIKSSGYRVFRNVNGEHIVKQDEDFIYKAFGGVFGKIFKGE